jgi:thymidylate synthase ThyX
MQEFKGLGCTVKVIADSVALSSTGKRITTFQLRYWRAIHSELMTHRVFSRNASSSRAIPVAKVLEQVRNEPAGPIHWGAHQRGMQAWAECVEPVALEEYEQFDNPSDQPLYLCGEVSYTAKEAWQQAAYRAAEVAEAYMRAGYHKQVVNRLLEPFQYISVVLTATEFGNWFELRDHEDAQPEIQDLARTMKLAMDASSPVVRGAKRDDPTSWHLPYVSDAERKLYRIDVLQAISTARNARVSYLTHDGDEPSPDKDLGLFDDLVGAEPLHASPTEHVACPLTSATDTCKNFVGWHQFRDDVEKRIQRAKKAKPVFYFDTYNPKKAPVAIRAS